MCIRDRLGLDEELVNKKRELREESVRLKDIKKQFRKDSLLKEYFGGEKDASLEVRDLKELIENLESQIADFKVAENYEEISQQSESARDSWQKIRNELHGFENALRQIKDTLAVQPEVDPSFVYEMYKNAQLQIPSLVKRKLEEVTDFNNKLIASREKRLASGLC